MSGIVKNAHHNFFKHKEMIWDRLICPTNTAKPKDIQFTITQDKESQQIITI